MENNVLNTAELLDQYAALLSMGLTTFGIGILVWFLLFLAIAFVAKLNWFNKTTIRFLYSINLSILLIALLFYLKHSFDLFAAVYSLFKSLTQ